MRIGIDLMGGDSSPEILFEAVLQVAEHLTLSDSLVVYLTHAVEKELLGAGLVETSFVEGAARIDLHVVRESIAMDDEPLSAIRLKRESSLVVGIRQIGERKIDAFVTAGNTGALIACAAITLPRLDGIERSSLLALLPTQNNPVAIVDVGGTVSCTSEQLVQYAHIGAACQRCSLGIDVPTVGLLNIGEESKKGTAVVREAYEYLQKESEQPKPKIKFLGNIEGREVFQGKVDVLVTDGFTGNVLLKTSEGVSSFIFNYLQETLQDSSSTELHQVLDDMQRHFSYDEYPGALVCGVDGVLVKCHGTATKKAMVQSIQGAMNLVEHDLLRKMKEELSDV